jgi:hypothetical protein
VALQGLSRMLGLPRVAFLESTLGMQPVRLAALAVAQGFPRSTGFQGQQRP